MYKAIVSILQTSKPSTYLSRVESHYNVLFSFPSNPGALVQQVGLGVAPLVQGDEQEHLDQHPREAVFVCSSFVQFVNKSKINVHIFCNINCMYLDLTR